MLNHSIPPPHLIEINEDAALVSECKLTPLIEPHSKLLEGKDIELK